MRCRLIRPEKEPLNETSLEYLNLDKTKHYLNPIAPSFIGLWCMYQPETDLWSLNNIVIVTRFSFDLHLAGCLQHYAV